MNIQYIVLMFLLTTPEYCLALNIFHEARGEPETGQLAVAYVVLNRVENKKYSNSICGVVREANQFSWTLNNINSKCFDKDAWDKSVSIARQAKSKHKNLHDWRREILYYHTIDTKPSWSVGMLEKKRIGNHVFY